MYRLGQLIRNQISSYSTDMDYEIGLVVNNNAVNFYDRNITINGDKILTNNSYYLRFQVKQRVDSVQDFNVKLNNSEESLSDDFQSIKMLSVKQGQDYTIFETIFTPSTAYDQIVFELKRIDIDFTTFDEPGKQGRIMDIDVLDFYIIKNVITDYLQFHYPELKYLKKIGLQGPPGFMFTINGEEIRLGKTGIYELYNEKIPIRYIGFIIKDSAQTPDGKDFFILDFKY